MMHVSRTDFLSGPSAEKTLERCAKEIADAERAMSDYAFQFYSVDHLMKKGFSKGSVITTPFSDSLVEAQIQYRACVRSLNSTDQKETLASGIRLGRSVVVMLIHLRDLLKVQSESLERRKLVVLAHKEAAMKSQRKPDIQDVFERLCELATVKAGEVTFEDGSTLKMRSLEEKIRRFGLNRDEYLRHALKIVVS